MGRHHEYEHLNEDAEAGDMRSQQLLESLADIPHARLERYTQARHESRIVRGKAYALMCNRANRTGSEEVLNQYVEDVNRFQPRNREAILGRVGRN